MRDLLVKAGYLVVFFAVSIGTVMVAERLSLGTDGKAAMIGLFLGLFVCIGIARLVMYLKGQPRVPKGYYDYDSSE